jgi:hypothetical protein
VFVRTHPHPLSAVRPERGVSRASDAGALRRRHETEGSRGNEGVPTRTQTVVVQRPDEIEGVACRGHPRGYPIVVTSMTDCP